MELDSNLSHTHTPQSRLDQVELKEQLVFYDLHLILVVFSSFKYSPLQICGIFGQGRMSSRNNIFMQ